MLSPSDILQGRYRIIRKLGEGGMGAVYQATDERFGTPVALKEVIFESGDDRLKAHLTGAFEREAKSLATARHEAVPFVRDYFSEKDRQFLVMELVEGDDLAQLLSDRKAPFLIDDGCDWMRQLLDALDYLHNLKPSIIHRDIKPQNLKLTSRKRLKLLDFGIAKSGEVSALTVASRTFIGATLNYSPIEQILRVIDPTFREFIILKHEVRAKTVLAQNTDSRADIFAAGATFYHLLTDHLPEDATKRTLDLWEGKSDPLSHPSDLNPLIPMPFGDFLLKAMAISRDDRFGSAAEMLEAMSVASAPENVPIRAKDIPTVPMRVAPTFPASERQMQAASATKPHNAPEGTPTEPLISPTVESVPEASETDEWSDLVSRHSVGDTVPNAVADLQIQNQATVPDRPRQVVTATKSKNNLYWVIPAAAGILIVAIFGGGIFLIGSFGTAANAPVANTRRAQEPTSDRLSTESPTPDIWVSPTPVAAVSPERDGKPPKLKRERTEIPKVGHAAKKPPSRQGQDLTCVYTNSCKE